MIYISQSKALNAGRGVFTNTDIKTGETIESCPFIEIPFSELERLGESILVNYVYFFGKRKERMLLALGYGSIYNHNYTPNAEYKINSSGRTIEFIAIENIKKGDEITVNYHGVTSFALAKGSSFAYNQGNLKSAPLWFE